MEKIVLDAMRSYNRDAMDWSFLGMGGFSRRRITFEECCNSMRSRLYGVSIQNDYRDRISGAIIVLKEVIQSTGVTRKEDICPTILVFAELLKTSNKPKHKLFIDIFRCMFYSEYGISNPLSLPGDAGLRDPYSDFVEN